MKANLNYNNILSEIIACRMGLIGGLIVVIGGLEINMLALTQTRHLKNLSIILCLLFSFTTSAQSLTLPFKHAQDSAINKFDSTGQKTGLWVKYFYDINGRRRIVNTGNYKAGKKIGV